MSSKVYIEMDGKRVELSQESADRLRKELAVEEYDVPENIEFEATDNDMVGLKFDGDRSLWFYTNWNVSVCYTINKVKCKLVPCKREDLKPGDWAFRCDNKEPDFSEKSLYCLIIDDKDYLSVRCDSVVGLDSTSYEYWYKVVKK